MFDYIQNIRAQHTVPCTADILDVVIHSTIVNNICAELADYREQMMRGEMSRDDFATKKAELKRRLPAFCFHAHFKNGRRLNAEAIPSGLSILDIDHIPSPETFYNEKVKERTKELGIVLVHMTPSAEGLRIVFTLPQKMTLAEGQQWLAGKLGLKDFDEACKDYARCSFAVPADYIFFIDKEQLFATPTPQKTDTDTSDTNATPTINQRRPQPTEETAATSNEAVDIDPNAELLFDAFVAASGLAPAALNSKGTRHNSLVSLLSMGICRLIPQDQLRAIIACRMPEYARESDCQQLIKDFYEKYTNTNRPMSFQLRKIYTESLRNKAATATTSENDIEQFEAKRETEQQAQAACTNNILNTLPLILRKTLEGVPANMHMPVLCSVLPLAAAYADGVQVRYCDGQLHRLNLMSVIVGPQASGKSVCKSRVDLWMKQMLEDDARAREIEDKWKQEKKRRKANEKAPEDPCVLIRSVPITISCSTLLRRFKNSRGHTLFSFGEELDTLRKTNGAGSWSQKYDIYRLAFDNGVWGQDYNSDQAESGVVPVAYNFSILGTYGALRRCFKNDNVENGLSSRIFIAEMPDGAFAPMPVYGKKAEGLSADIDAAVTSLRARQGFIETPLLRQAIGEWVEKKRIEAMADGDIVKDTYRKRAAVIGFRCGVVASLLEGEENEKVLDFARLTAEYILEKQCNFFGEALLSEYKSAEQEMVRQSRNGFIFDKLPPEFTFNDLQKEKGANVSRNVINNIIYRWKKSGWIEKKEDGKWMKTRQDK
ncbi:BT4734/BF3469 family protein [Prevotella melaninogenica]